MFLPIKWGFLRDLLVMGSVMVTLYRKMCDYENTWGGWGGGKGRKWKIIMLGPIHVQVQFLIFICLFIT